MSVPQRFSIVVVGDGAVGKSAMTLRFLRDQFHDEYDPTIEDSYCKHIEVDGQRYTLDITDTAGQEEYRGHWNDMFLRSGDGFICVFSITSKSSFQELVGFRTQIWRAKEDEYVPIVIAGNKSDLEDERQVDTSIAQEFAQQSNAFFIETSAKTGFNINEMMNELVRAIVRNKRHHHHHHHQHHQPQQQLSPPQSPPTLPGSGGSHSSGDGGAFTTGRDGASSLQTIGGGGGGGGYQANMTPMAKAHVNGMPISLESTGCSLTPSTSIPPSADALLDTAAKLAGTLHSSLPASSLRVDAASSESALSPPARLIEEDLEKPKEQDQQQPIVAAAVISSLPDPSSLSSSPLSSKNSGDSGDTDVSNAAAGYHNDSETVGLASVHLPVSTLSSRTSSSSSPAVVVASSTATATTTAGAITATATATATSAPAMASTMATAQVEPARDHDHKHSNSDMNRRLRTRSTSVSPMSPQQLLVGHREPESASLQDDSRQQELKKQPSSPVLSEMDESCPPCLSTPFPSRNTRSRSRSRSMCPSSNNSLATRLSDFLDDGAAEDDEDEEGQERDSVVWDDPVDGGGSCVFDGADFAFVEEYGLYAPPERGDRGGSTLQLASHSHCLEEVHSGIRARPPNSIAIAPWKLLIDQSVARPSTPSTPSSIWSSPCSSPCSSLSSSLSLSLALASPTELDSITDYFSVASSYAAPNTETTVDAERDSNHILNMQAPLEPAGKDDCGKEYSCASETPLSLMFLSAPLGHDEHSITTTAHISQTQECLNTVSHDLSRPDDKKHLRVDENEFDHHRRKHHKGSSPSLSQGAIITDAQIGTVVSPTTLADAPDCEGMRTRFRNTRRPPVNHPKTSSRVRSRHSSTSSPSPSLPLPGQYCATPPTSSSFTMLANSSSSSALSSSTAPSTLPFTPSARALSLASIDMTWNNPTQKPPFSYASLIARAILESRELRLTLGDIYGWITSRFPWYKHSPPAWQNSIRHNLSLNKAFRKLERAIGEPGKGCFWSLEMDDEAPTKEENAIGDHSSKKRAAKGNIDMRSPRNASSQRDTGMSAIQERHQQYGGEDSDAEERDGSKGSPGPHNAFSPAASEEADHPHVHEQSQPRRSGRARKPPKPRDLDDLVLASSTSALSLHRTSSSSPLTPSGALSTPPCSPGGHAEKLKASLGRTSSLDSIRKSLGGSVGDAGVGDSDLIMTSRRVRRPPPKLSEFVSSEDFKASVVGGARTGRRAERTVSSQSSARTSLSPTPETPLPTSTSSQEGGSSFFTCTRSPSSSADHIVEPTKKERRPRIEIVIPLYSKTRRPSLSFLATTTATTTAAPGRSSPGGVGTTTSKISSTSSFLASPPSSSCKTAPTSDVGCSLPTPDGAACEASPATASYSSAASIPLRRPCPPSVSLSALSLRKRPSLDQTVYGGMRHDGKKLRRLSMQERRRTSMATGSDDEDVDECEAARKRRRERKEEHQRLLRRIRQEALRHEEDDWSGSDFEFLREEEEKYLRRICAGTRRGVRPQQYRWRNDDMSEDDVDDEEDDEDDVEEGEGAAGRRVLEDGRGIQLGGLCAGEDEAERRAKALLLDPSVIAYGFDSGDQDYILDYHQSPLFNSVSWPEFSDVKTGMSAPPNSNGSNNGNGSNMPSGMAAAVGTVTTVETRLPVAIHPMANAVLTDCQPKMHQPLSQPVPPSLPLPLVSQEGA
ncbi:Ras GTPase [Actinomortierella ambigua]|uniref:Ras GTPase n=1 Tax=Actinomortierella ambigua TaxID=1343610 RepID=A0A9P6Q2M2_9FUNG|nr:Ras GTPase [Actinomortierella ambigua]